MRLWGTWQRFRQSKPGTYGLCILVPIVALALLAPLITRYSPLKIDTGPLLGEPSWGNPMGLDQYGRDVFTDTLYGLRTSLMVGTMVGVCVLFLGIVAGSVGGYFGGKIDMIIMKVTEMLLIIPPFVLALVIIAFLRPSVWNAVLVLSALSWPSTARIARGEYMSLKEQDFTLSAKSLGQSDWGIMYGEILPNALAPVIVDVALQAGKAMIWEAGLSFLGLGDPNVTSLGLLIASAQQNVLVGAWWLVFFPGTFLFLIILSMVLIGDGLNEALNPRVVWKA